MARRDMIAKMRSAAIVLLGGGRLTGAAVVTQANVTRDRKRRSYSSVEYASSRLDHIDFREVILSKANPSRAMRDDARVDESAIVGVERSGSSAFQTSPQ